jgi:hypothetical protein
MQKGTFWLRTAKHAKGDVLAARGKTCKKGKGFGCVRQNMQKSLSALYGMICRKVHDERRHDLPGVRFACAVANTLL